MLAAPGPLWPVASLFWLGALGAFLARTPLQALLSKPQDQSARLWLGLYAAAALLGFLPLFFFWQRWLLLAFALPVALLLAANLRANLTGRRFSAANEAAGVLGLCLGAPAAYYALSGGLQARAWSLWLLSGIYFLGPIFHVKLAALQHRASADASFLPDLKAMRRRSLAYHGLALAAVVLWGALGDLPAAAAIPFGAALVKAGLRALQEPQRVDFRRLGFQEVGYTILFVICLRWRP